MQKFIKHIECMTSKPRSVELSMMNNFAGSFLQIEPKYSGRIKMIRPAI